MIVKFVHQTGAFKEPGFIEYGLDVPPNRGDGVIFPSEFHPFPCIVHQLTWCYSQRGLDYVLVMVEGG